MSPGSEHEVTIRAITPSSPQSLSTTRHRFHTAGGGLPDAPLNVSVEAGPQEGSVLLTWLPVTLSSAAAHATSNGARVTGYAVYAVPQGDGEQPVLVKQLHGATSEYYCR